MINRMMKNELFKYLVGGGATTLISIITFYIFLEIGIDYKVATIFSFILSATFAYFINKIYVFKHKTNNLRESLKAYTSFMSARLVSLAIDFLGMILLVEVCNVAELYSKILVNIIIVIINYAISKIFIFKNNEKKNDEINLKL